MGVRTEQIEIATTYIDSLAPIIQDAATDLAVGHHEVTATQAEVADNRARLELVGKFIKVLPAADFTKFGDNQEFTSRVTMQSGSEYGVRAIQAATIWQGRFPYYLIGQRTRNDVGSRYPVSEVMLHPPDDSKGNGLPIPPWIFRLRADDMQLRKEMVYRNLGKGFTERQRMGLMNDMGALVIEDGTPGNISTRNTALDIQIFRKVTAETVAFKGIRLARSDGYTKMPKGGISEEFWTTFDVEKNLWELAALHDKRDEYLEIFGEVSTKHQIDI